jgi:hypothetical protein
MDFSRPGGVYLLAYMYSITDVCLDATRCFAESLAPPLGSLLYQFLHCRRRRPGQEYPYSYGLCQGRYFLKSACFQERPVSMIKAPLNFHDGFMDNFIWVFNKKEDLALGWTFICSLALHFLLFTILVIKPIYPLSGESDKVDIIWLYPALQPTAKIQTPARSEHAVQAAAVRKDITASKVDDSMKEERRKEARMPQVQHIENSAEEVEQAEEVPEPQSVTEMIAVKVETKKIMILPDMPPSKTKAVEIRSADEAFKLKPKAGLNEKAGFENISVAKERKLVKETGINKSQAMHPETVAKQTSETKNKALQDNGKVSVAQEPKKQSPRTEPTATKAGTAQQTKVPKEKIIGQQVAALKKPIPSTSRSGIDSNSAGLKPAPVRPVEATGNNNLNVAGQGPSTQHVTGLKPLEATPGNGVKIEKPSDRQPPGIPAETRGIMIPPVTGDLKLVVTGTTNLKITAGFKEYLKTRHNKPMTRSEAKRVQPVTLQHRTRENSIEAVIGIAGEGVYEYVVEPLDNKPVHAGFALKVHESGDNAKTRSLGAKTIKEKVVVTKILMPEGIIWEDDSYFSGNMEDSESTTKYNSDTGVIWKEYHQ